MIVAALVGCGLPPGPGPGIDTAGPDLPPPTIADLALACDVGANRWHLTLEASSWAGNAVSWWTEDGAYIEKHRLPSVAFAEDGSAETFDLSLGIVSDWRSQSDGSSTAFTCARDVDVLVTLEDLDGNRVDCATRGPDPARWADIDDTPSCDDPGGSVR